MTDKRHWHVKKSILLPFYEQQDSKSIKQIHSRQSNRLTSYVHSPLNRIVEQNKHMSLFEAYKLQQREESLRKRNKLHKKLEDETGTLIISSQVCPQQILPGRVRRPNLSLTVNETEQLVPTSTVHQLTCSPKNQLRYVGNTRLERLQKMELTNEQKKRARRKVILCRKKKFIENNPEESPVGQLSVWRSQQQEV